MTRPSRKFTAAALAALGLTSLSPMQQGAALLTAAGAALWASPALAQSTIPGVGQIVKKRLGNSPIIASSDANGETRLTGLEPGEYSVRVFEGAEETIMKVGRDGRLAFVAMQDDVPSDTQQPDPRRRKSQVKQLKGYTTAAPQPRLRAEQIAFDHNCDEPGKCPPIGTLKMALNLNVANADEMIRTAEIVPDVAKTIVADREKNGAFKGIEDFAQRICPQTDVDFSRTSIRMGDLVVILTPRAGDKGSVPGFQCTRADTGQFTLYGKKHNYVGHVTLLR
jgi:hypothetical protein